MGFIMKILIVIGNVLVLMYSPAKLEAKTNAEQSQQYKISEQTEATIAALKPDLGQVFARAVLEPRSKSKARGVVLFAKTEYGVNILASIEEVEPGLKGIHTHEFGDCSADDASSAGDHYNPGNKPHGHISFHGVHAGDFGNIPVDQNGTGVLSVVLTEDMDLGLASWEEFIGKSVVLHDDKDDLISQPSGESGNRIACGVIQKFEN